MNRLVITIILATLTMSGMASELYEAVMSYQADRGALSRKYSNSLSEEYFVRFERHYTDWLERLSQVDYRALSADGKTDWLLFRNHLEKELYFHRAAHGEFREVAHVAAFRHPLDSFVVFRRMATRPDSPALAAVFSDAARQLAENRKEIEASEPFESWQKAELAASVISSLRRAVGEAYRFYYDYDPEFTWWMEKPWEHLNSLMQEYERFLRSHYSNLVVRDDGSGIIGRPIGRRALEQELRFEFIPYSPEELIARAEREFEWCEAEIVRASSELGFGTDWRAALEYVKEQYVPPGVWPGMVAEMVVEATDYVMVNDLLTIPELAVETWRTSMLSAQAQRVSPFFLGGEVIQISYPTSEMTHDEKMMSMRGNNPHFSRAVVHHEIIPGHHLQQFMNQRHHPHRRAFSTAFWTEGWALYWEFILYDKGFAETPEDRIGMLFWRMHRAARIIFSLGYHLGEMSPQECIDFLVERVGHERANAEAEVRRSFTGRYGPLYQIAYMVGGFQFYALREEMVESGAMSEKEFHDFIIRQNSLPVELLRARIRGEELPPDHTTEWRFLR